MRLGLVLGAGGARGLAHIGALKVFAQLGLDFDLVAGASMGAIVGAAYAADLPMEQVERVVREIRARDIIRFGRARAGLLDPTGMETLLRSVFGERSFADLRIPFATVAVDVREARLVVLRDGPLVPGLLAATAIPLVFPPVRLGEHWLVDGGVLDGLPVSLAQEMGAERTVAVDADIHASQPLRGRLIVGLVRAARQRLLAAPADRLTRRLVLGAWLNCILGWSEPDARPDVLIRADYGRMTSNDFHRRAHSIKLGEAAAWRAAPELTALAQEARERSSSGTVADA